MMTKNQLPYKHISPLSAQIYSGEVVMAFKDDVVKARSYIVFIVGLLFAFSVVYYVENHSQIKSVPAPAIVKSAIQPMPKTQEQGSEMDKAPAAPMVVEKATPVDKTATAAPVVAATQVVAATTPAPVTATPVAPVVVPPPPPLAKIVASSRIPAKRTQRELNDKEQAWATIAWHYFENNTQAQTGLVNSVNNYNASTMWDTASYIIAAISAERLGLIDRPTLDSRMSQLLASMAKMPLFEGKLPNKSYNTKTLTMSNYANKDTAKGIGYSAIDMGRMLIALQALNKHYPNHAAEVKQVVSRWTLAAMVHDGLLFGAFFDKNGGVVNVQEGRLGYEQYAAKAVKLFKFDAATALNYQKYLSYVDVYGIQVPIDVRDAKTGAQNYVLSEPYIMDGLEFGFDAQSKELAWRVFSAQEERFKATGILTAVSEDHIDVSPYFVYNTVYVAGKTWATITDNGVDASDYRSLSTKTVFGWYALYNTPYTAKMLQAIESLNDPAKGWYAGLYEKNKQPNKAITANTNAVILESLAYIKKGKLL
jgi:hypothetical protein